jgi:hypothetical protein
MPARFVLVALATVLTIASPRARTGQRPPGDAALPAFTDIPVVSDHRYRGSGAVRPFVLFWISRDNVGGARITHRRGDDGSFALEMLTGSDPARAPFGTNRWGYIREVVRGDTADLVAVKTDTDEETIEEAKTNVRNKKASGVLLFIRERVTAHETIAWTTLADVGRDVSFRDVDFVLGQIPGLQNWEERRIARPPEVRPGFLTAFNEMMAATAKLWSSGTPPKQNSAPKVLTYLHRAELFDLHQDQLELVENVPTGSGERVRALRARFRIWNRQTKEWSGDFVSVYGVSGALAGVPLRLTYQPRWWLKTELAIDDTIPYPAADR